jgi:uncharacterized membrane protein YtjA (UPF0391 family)
MLGHRTFFLILAILAGSLGVVGAAGIFAFMWEFLAAVFMAIVLLMVFRGRK